MTVDEQKVPIPQYTKKQMCTKVPPAKSRAGVPWAAESVPVERNAKGEFCTVSPGFRAPAPAPFGRIALFHYITRSREDYEVKRGRGGGSTKIRTWEEFNEFAKCAPGCLTDRQQLAFQRARDVLFTRALIKCYFDRSTDGEAGARNFGTRNALGTR